MRTLQMRRPLPKYMLRRGDGLRLTLATVGLFATLATALFFMGSYMLRSFAASTAAKATLAEQARTIAEAQARREAQVRRVGTIVVAADRGSCEELRFDNLTGAFIALVYVDCDTRLNDSAVTTGAKPDGGVGMRDMLKSFQR